MAISAEPRAATLHVLVVDDSEGNVELLEAIIEQPGVQVLRALSGAEALEVVEKHAVALAILDVNMPGMSGFELAERLRADPKTSRVPVLFLTAAPHDSRFAFRGYELGAVDFLFKPIEADMIRYKVNVFLELHRQRVQIEDNLRINELFVAVMAHDLRNPLSAVVMGADLLVRSKEPMTADVASKVRASARRMGAMIEQLCDLSQSRLGRGIPITRRNVDFGSILKRTVQELELAHPGRSFEKTTSGDLSGSWDPDRLEQILSNLCGNALRHGDHQGRISIEAHGEGDALTFSIKNRGGIPAEQLGSLFEPFKPSSSPKSRREGLGLGLYIVHQLVKAHGGRISVESEDETTTFTVVLPKSPPASPPEAGSAV